MRGFEKDKGLQVSVTQPDNLTLNKGAFFWGYSGYSYSGLGITDYTEFQFRKERSYMFQIWKRNRRWPENYYICARTWVSANKAAEHGQKVFAITTTSQKNAYSVYFRVNRILSILFILLWGAEWRYSVHSENGIAPKRTQIPYILSIPIPE